MKKFWGPYVHMTIVNNTVLLIYNLKFLRLNGNVFIIPQNK